jgi:hypothetical protein
MKRIALTLGMLAVTVACDKARTVDARPVGDAGTATAAIDLSRRPDIVFQLFGESDDPRMLPVAAVVDGALVQIELSANGWKQFDAIYARADTTYPLYRDGRPSGAAHVRRGMWPSGEEPLYSLPGCTQLAPLAAVRVEGADSAGFTVEYLAATPGVLPIARSPVKLDDALRASARDGARDAARKAGIGGDRLPDRALRVYAISTGTSDDATLVASYLDPEADGAGASTAHVLAIHDRRDGAWVTTYTHLASGDVASGEYRRYVDHLDLTGDGVDELLLEGWRFGGDTFPVVLGWRGGAWREVFRGRASWCLDPRPEAD